MVKRSVIALERVLSIVSAKDVSLTLLLDGVGIVTTKDISSVIPSTLLVLIMVVMTYLSTLCFLRQIDTIALVL
jgi:hypothetical protein